MAFEVKKERGGEWQLLDDGLVYGNYSTKAEAEQAQCDLECELDLDEAVTEAVDEAILQVAREQDSDYVTIKARVRELYRH